MNSPDLQRIVEAALRQVKYPGYSRDIVSFGMVKSVQQADGVVTVGLEVNSSNPQTVLQIQSAAEAVLRAQPQVKSADVRVEVLRAEPLQPRKSKGHQPPLPLLPEDAQHEDAVFDPDPMPVIASMMRPDLAPGAGYGDDGPDPLGGPQGDRHSMQWRGAAPVFQWEINPSEASLPYGEAEIEREGWLFRLWWQMHPAGLVYAAISALAEEDPEERPHARLHPIGRNVAVNLVYDLQRHGVVAVYGTALDFRPFVEVFLEAYPLQQTPAQQPNLTSATSPPPENPL